jgi:hypothetical protein
MDTQFLLTIMAVFTGTAAVALLIQAAFLIGIYKSSRKTQVSFEKLAARIESVADNSLSAVIEIKANIGELTTKTNAILDSTGRQIKLVEGVVNDATTRARNQMDRAEMVLDDAVSRAHETLAVVHTGIMKPIREINGVALGVRAALQYFFQGGRPNPDRATADEEMFI